MKNHDVDSGAIESGAIERLLYRSISISGANSGLGMSDILAEARPANARDGVTGVLTAVDGHFVQIIEGPKPSIDALMVRLARDPRHVRIQVLDRRAAPSRAFGDWDMVSPRLAPVEISLLSLLLQNPTAPVEDYISLLSRAIAGQEKVIETGRRAVIKSDVPPPDPIGWSVES